MAFYVLTADVPLRNYSLTHSHCCCCCCADEGETTQDKKALKIVRIQERAITVLTVTDEWVKSSVPVCVDPLLSTTTK